MDHGKPVLKSEMLYRVHDPVAHTDIKWDSTTKEAKVIHWPQAVPDLMKSIVEPFGGFQQLPGGEHLGSKTIEGLLAEGLRHSYVISPESGEGGQGLRVVHERWFCPDLEAVVLETNEDPRTGAWRNELVNIVRSEPDPATFRPPAGYVLRHVRVPAQ